jgi:hypothetical protein
MGRAIGSGYCKELPHQDFIQASAYQSSFKNTKRVSCSAVYKRLTRVSSSYRILISSYASISHPYTISFLGYGGQLARFIPLQSKVMAGSKPQTTNRNIILFGVAWAQFAPLPSPRILMTSSSTICDAAHPLLFALVMGRCVGFEVGWVCVRRGERESWPTWTTSCA